MKKRLIAILSIILCLTILSGCGLVQYLQYDPKFREIRTFFDKEGLYECLTHEEFAELIGKYSIDGEKLQVGNWKAEIAKDSVKPFPFFKPSYTVSVWSPFETIWHLSKNLTG